MGAAGKMPSHYLFRVWIDKQAAVLNFKLVFPWKVLGLFCFFLIGILRVKLLGWYVKGASSKQNNTNST